MRRLSTAILALLVAATLRGGAPGRAAAAPGATPEPAAGAGRSFQKGMVFGLFARDEPGHAVRGLAELKDLGVDSVSITIPWVMADIRSVTMAPRADMTPSDASLAFTIREAHGRGMRVFLMPFLYIDRMEASEWRGTLAPPDWQAWFRAYDEFILHYAALAGRERVEYFSVGSELCSTESRGDDWLALIAKVRAVYKGRLTYSANWDHRGDLPFARALDFLGMNAYFKLSDLEAPSEDELVSAWQEIREDVASWRRSLGLPMVITEVGYPSRRGASTDPWNYAAEGTADLEGQRRCYRAFQRVWGGEPGLLGVYFYLWWGEGGPGDSGYTPRGKPAANVIRDWYAR